MREKFLPPPPFRIFFTKHRVKYKSRLKIELYLSIVSFSRNYRMLKKKMSVICKQLTNHLLSLRNSINIYIQRKYAYFMTKIYIQMNIKLPYRNLIYTHSRMMNRAATIYKYRRNGKRNSYHLHSFR